MKKKSKPKFPSDNTLFARHVYEFMHEHISSKDMKAFMVERLAIVYDTYPQKKIEDHKAYFNWLGVHNEGLKKKRYGILPIGIPPTM